MRSVLMCNLAIAYYLFSPRNATFWVHNWRGDIATAIDEEVATKRPREREHLTEIGEGHGIGAARQAMCEAVAILANPLDSLDRAATGRSGDEPDSRLARKGVDRDLPQPGSRLGVERVGGDTAADAGLDAGRRPASAASRCPAACSCQPAG